MPSNALFILLAPFIFVFLWATGFVVARFSAGHVDPVWFLTLRFPLAAIFMLGLALAQRAAWPNSKQAFHAAVTGTLLHAAYLAPIYWAVAHGLPAGVSALIVGLQPLITAFLAARFLGESISRWHWLGLATGLCGVALVLAPKFSFATVGGITPLTAGLVFFSTLGVASGTIYQKKFASTLPLSTGGFWQYCGASFVVLIASVALGEYKFDQSWQAWFALGWAVIVLSIISILLLLMMINNGAVSKVSAYIFLVPGIAALMAYFMFDEQLTPIQLLGMAMCAASVALVTRAATTPAKAQ